MRNILTAGTVLVLLGFGCMPGSDGSDGEMATPLCEAPAEPCAGALPHMFNGGDVARVAVSRGGHVAVCSDVGSVLATACTTEDRSAIRCNLNGSPFDGLPRCSGIDAEQSGVGVTDPTAPFLPRIAVSFWSDCDREECTGAQCSTVAYEHNGIRMQCDASGSVVSLSDFNRGCAWIGEPAGATERCDTPAPVFDVLTP